MFHLHVLLDFKPFFCSSVYVTSYCLCLVDELNVVFSYIVTFFCCVFLHQVEKDDSGDISYINGHYNIPNCIEILRKLKDRELLNGREFTYALELIKDGKNRVIVDSLRYWQHDLAAWIVFNFKKDGFNFKCCLF